MRSIVFSNVLADIRRYKFLILGFLIVCIGAAGGYGYFSAASSSIALSEEEQASVDDYNAKIEEYDKSIEDVKSGIEAQTVTIDSLQSYVDNSIYMKMDPDAVQYITVQYALTYEEGVNAGNVNQAILAFIKDGGMKENLSASTGLEVRYWNEVLTSSINGNVLNITLMHYDADKAKDAMGQIKEQVVGAVGEISKTEGKFSIEEIETSQFEKSEVSVINTQNTNYNNLRSYLNTKADLETKLVNTGNARDKYIVESRPECLDRQPQNPKKSAIKYAILGAFFAAAVLIFIEFVVYLFGNGIRDAADIEECGVSVLGLYSANKYNPEPERACMDAALIMEGKKYKQVQLYRMGDSDDIQKVSADYLKIFEQSGFHVTEAAGTVETADVLRSLINTGCCILIIDRMHAKQSEIRQVVEVCKKYHVEVLGSILCS